jgi:hypothetical protein
VEPYRRIEKIASPLEFGSPDGGARPRTYAAAVTTRTLAYAAAVGLLAVSVVIAIVGISAGPLSCPVDTVAVVNAGSISCERYVDPVAAPSHPELLEATRDTRTAERLLVVGVGGLGSLFLITLGLRLSTSANRRGRSP